MTIIKYGYLAHKPEKLLFLYEHPIINVGDIKLPLSLDGTEHTRFHIICEQYDKSQNNLCSVLRPPSFLFLCIFYLSPLLFYQRRLARVLKFFMGSLVLGILLSPEKREQVGGLGFYLV